MAFEEAGEVGLVVEADAHRYLGGGPAFDELVSGSLLADAIGPTAQLGAEIGCRGLLVHAETPEARNFYLHLVPEFEPSPTDDLHLFLLMKDNLKTLRD